MARRVEPSTSKTRAVGRSRVSPAVEPPPVRAHVEAVSDLAEICAWLGTFGERLRLARVEDRQELATDVRRWKDRPSATSG